MVPPTVRASLVMPAMVSMPVAEASAASPRSSERAAPRTAPQPIEAPAPAAAAPTSEVKEEAAPVEAPRDRARDGHRNRQHAQGCRGRRSQRRRRRIARRNVLFGAAAVGPPARRRRHQATAEDQDVKPVYPQNALSDQARCRDHRGDDRRGRQSARGSRASIDPVADQAALDAVRQWEYTPSIVNGVPVAVVMTVLVNFAIL
jgi:protein TonB